jgi:hypothetical protein
MKDFFQIKKELAFLNGAVCLDRRKYRLFVFIFGIVFQPARRQVCSVAMQVIGIPVNDD